MISPNEISELTTYAFVDGAFLRKMAEVAGDRPYNPQRLVTKLSLPAGQFRGKYAVASRTLYFDADPEPLDSRPELDKYWTAVELLSDTHLVFGWTRGKTTNRSGPRQKAVDTALAVEMVAGAYNKRFDIAFLFAGDADFVPIVNEVRRAGACIVVAAATDPAPKPKYAYANELRSAADRFIELPNAPGSSDYNHYFAPLI